MEAAHEALAALGDEEPEMREIVRLSLAQAQWAAGKTEEAIASCRAAVELSRETGNPFGVSSTLAMWLQLLDISGRRRELLALARQAEAWFPFHLQMTPGQVRRLYRRRFGIETSYRCASKVRGWTTSSHPAYRFLLLALGVLLVNIWALLRWLFNQQPRRGGRKLNVKLFQLMRFAKFLLRALESHYRCVHHITALAPPLP